MLCRDAAYGHAGAASGFRGDRTYSGDADDVERIHNVNAERLRTIEQGANGVGAGEQEPVKGAQVAKSFVERAEISRRVKRDHRLEHRFGAALFQFANQRLCLL